MEFLNYEIKLDTTNEQRCKSVVTIVGGLSLQFLTDMYKQWDQEKMLFSLFIEKEIWNN